MTTVVVFILYMSGYFGQSDKFQTVAIAEFPQEIDCTQISDNMNALKIDDQIQYSCVSSEGYVFKGVPEIVK